MKIFDRVRTSQFGIPALMVIGGIALAVVTNTIDDSGRFEGAPFVLPTTRQAAQTLLSTVATSTITVAAIVFSVTAVVSQLSASQYSPRVLQGFLDDRYQQGVLGTVGGTFSFSLIGQALISGPANEQGGNLAATIGMVLGVISVLAIIGFIGRVTVRVRVDDTITRIADQTTEAMHELFARDAPVELDEHWSVAGDVPSARVTCRSEGWVRRVDVKHILDTVPPGTIVRVDVAVGDHITPGHHIATVWSTDVPEHIAETLRDRIVTTRPNRSIEGDPAFGFRQLVDIALRALSPGVNDPNTAADVIRSMIKPLRSGMLGDHPIRVHHGEDGRTVYLPLEPDWRDFFLDAFREIRLASRRQPIVAEAMLSAVGVLAEQAGEQQFRSICAEGTRIGRFVKTWDMDPVDTAATLRPLERFEATRGIHAELSADDPT